MLDTPFRKHTKDSVIKNTFIEDTNRAETDDGDILKLSKDNEGLDNRNFSCRE